MVLPDSVAFPEELSDKEVLSTEHDVDEELVRSKSQLEKDALIQGVLDRTEICQDPITDLQRSVSQISAALNEELELERSLSQQWSAATRRSSEVDSALKKARNLGEDLLEDMLMLDKLSGLRPENRSKRKQAIGTLETLLDNVDKAKARLARHQKGLRQCLDSTSKQLEERTQRQVEEPKRETVELNENQQRQFRDAQKTLRKKRMRAAQPQTARAASREIPVVETSRPGLPMPDPAMWKSVHLPLRFESREDQAAYEVFARIAGGQAENISLELSDDRTTLTVRGTRVPNAEEAQKLQRDLLAELRSLDASPGVLSDPRQLANAYAEMARGKFGCFEESFRVPRDVITSEIRAALHDDVLCVTLPRHVRCLQPPPYSGRHRADGYSPYRDFRDFGLFR
eukprot:TRINITY_DN20049_c0_g3_i1.p1 TRINITY_DN20049_c0_g3~~TRINITY_DN20049_c0_g3_i1.p1  ORF type:complete len:400 (-),score=54.81 TRINITY_DN20049_c0_g3_i1:250-1449(-)